MTKTLPHFKHRRKGLSSAAFVILGFTAVILAGAFMLCLPISNTSGKFLPFVDALFMSTSSVCVTGFAVVPPGTAFTGFGQAVVLILIQIGGLGFMTVTTFIFLLIRRKISFRDRLAIQVSLGADGNKGVVKLVRSVLILTLCVEAAGALLLLPVMVADHGAVGVWHAVFLSVSAFCNAGLDVFPHGASLAQYAVRPYVTLVISLLVIVGGLGFAVIRDVIKNKFRWRKFSLQTKIALPVTGALLAAGWLFILGVEFNNAGTIGNMPAGGKVLASFFESVTCRTAGFTAFDQNAMTHGGKFFTDILMFIGASPGSTGGGIKTTTFAVIILTMVAGFRKKSEVTAGKRSLGYRTVYKAFAVFFTAIALISAVTLFLTISEGGNTAMADAGVLSFSNILHDAISGFATVGVSTGIIPYLSVPGKLAVSFTMFIGRIGMLPVGLMFTAEEEDLLKYPEAGIAVG